ncbi:DUF6236 family protein [Sphingomonas psychrotolerans]|uniref:DUF6236 family protein n=1 Tax=Sphingomonas psychrotolerans TaxID=1327635 RepID=A0ABU3N512_9SPHN|nr:DUF6236 family protein [Sphingomonas psychrotolerans]MDT8758867.1 DUF6236 family protein [Sphingomonas psychrotolerans]
MAKRGRKSILSRVTDQVMRIRPPSEPSLTEDQHYPRDRVGPDEIELGPLIFQRFTPILAQHERGAVMADTMIGQLATSGNSGVREYTRLSRASELAALLLVDRVEYLSLSLGPFRAGERSRLCDEPFVSVRGVRTPSTSVQLDEVCVRAWHGHESVEPGRWTVWHEETFNPGIRNETDRDLAFKLTLQNALLIPEPSTDLETVLMFKERHRRELRALRHHLEAICIRVAHAGSDSKLMLLEVERLDTAIAEYNSSMRAANFGKVLANLSVKMDWAQAMRSTAPALTVTLAAMFTSQPLLAAAASLGGAIAAGLSIESAWGNKRPASYPFAYIAKVVQAVERGRL